ncbi:MAG: hypothetical protein FWE21_01545 [Defluviitaleaceae bacterium]|nr:hypothetical protein [Defluviitaleaceae bacterium]
MRERLQTWFNNLRERWTALTKSQKIKIAAIAGIVLIALVITLILAFRTTWVPAFGDADSLTVSQISIVLDDEGIRNRPDTGSGVVYVPQQDVERARTTVLLSPTMLDPRFTFRDAIAESGMGVTATMQNAMLTRAGATRIEDMIMMLPNVQTAMVTIDAPATHMMIAPTTPATASVMVSGNNLNSEIGENIALLVARSIQGLSLERVIVMDANTSQVLFENGQRNDSILTGRAVVEATELAERNLVQRNAIESLFPMYDEVTAQARVALDWFEINQRMIEHVNSVLEGDLGEHAGLMSSEHVQELRALIDDAGNWAMEPGTQPNDFPGGPLFGDEGREGAMALMEVDTLRHFLYDTIETMRTHNAPGRFIGEESSVSVFAGRHNIHHQEDLITLGLIEEGDAAWLQFQRETPVRVPYEGDMTAHIAHVAAATGIPVENISLMVYDFNSFVGLEPAPPLPLSTIVMLVLVIVFIGLLAFGLIRRTQPEVVEEIEPELSVEDLLVSSQLEESRISEAERLEEIRSQKDSAVKEQIDTFVTEKPEAVAQLLRNWINEDWE